jgi:UDP-glucose 4-epimerase
VLVTGAAGFLGRYVVAEMAARGWAVSGLDRHILDRDDALFRHVVEWEALTLPSSSLDDVLRRVQPDLLIHAAGPASVPSSVVDPALDFQISVQVFFQLLDSVRHIVPECRVLFLSSAAVYGNPPQLPIGEDSPKQPLSPYGYHKLICEKLAEEFHSLYGVRVSTVRLFSAYGAGLRRQVLWDICQKAINDPLVELLGTGEETRDFVNAGDIARAVACMVEAGSFEGQVYNLGTGQETSIRTLANLLLTTLEISKSIRFTGTRRTGDPVRWCADIRQLEALGYHPIVPISEGTARYARWVKSLEPGTR